MLLLKTHYVQECTIASKSYAVVLKQSNPITPNNCFPYSVLSYSLFLIIPLLFGWTLTDRLPYSSLYRHLIVHFHLD